MYNFWNNRRFDASRWGGGSDGHLYDFVKRGFQPSRWASGSDGHLYDFAKRLGDNDKTIQRRRQRQKCPPAPMGISTTLLRGWETMTRKIQIQSKKAKWALAQLDISTILYKHDVNDDNDESPAMLIEEAHLVPTLTILLKGSSLWYSCVFDNSCKKGSTHQGGEGARMDTSMILPKGAKVLKSFVSLPLLQKNH